MSSTTPLRPLDGVLIVDLSRMLPGAVLARLLLDLGARLIKVEEPLTGDPLRHAEPRIDGCGCGFLAFLRGAESLCLDLSSRGGAAALRRLAARADVLIESFRPGTLEKWGLAAASLRAAHPSLITCSLPAFGKQPEVAARIGHDLNLAAASGLLSLLPGGVPGVQIADVSAALLAGSAILAALLQRARGGSGRAIEQPLASGPLPFLAWAMLEDGISAPSVRRIVLGGRTPAYRLYRCADQREVAVAVIEPKFWVSFLQALGLPQLVTANLQDEGQARQAEEAIAGRLATREREHWLRLFAPLQLPVSPVNTVTEAARAPELRAAALVQDWRDESGAPHPLPGPFLPSFGGFDPRSAPGLDQHGAALRREFALDGAGESPAEKSR